MDFNGFNGFNGLMDFKRIIDLMDLMEFTLSYIHLLKRFIKGFSHLFYQIIFFF